MNRPNRPENKLLYLPEHQPLFGTMTFVSKEKLTMGDVISFDYTGKEPGDVKEMRWVFVLDPEYKGKLHGLTLGMTPKNALIQNVIDPMYEIYESEELYYSAVFKIAKTWDSYRTYFFDKIRNPRRFPYFLTARPIIKPPKQKG